MKKTAVILLFITLFGRVFSQQDTLKQTPEYSFIIQDSPAQLFSMRQFNQGYLSGYRLFAKGLYSVSRNEKVADLIQLGLQTLFLMPLTHEEGHRSILTANHIGSISQPFFNESGAAYVKGVSDQTLQDLRDHDLPTFIRLHTAGLESDYMLTKRMESMGSFDQEVFKNYKWEYYFRKLAILQYYLVGLAKYDIDLPEEANELERDIVGFDTYGAARHLYRPTMDYYRYTKYTQLIAAERSFITRIGYRSLFNLLNPLMLGKGSFKLSEHTRFNVGMGYTMSPFGDFIDENIWVKHQSLNFGIYLRQFQSRTNWFHGFGVSLSEYKPFERLSVSVAGHFWQQPLNFDFHTKESFTGGAVDLDLRYFFLDKRRVKINGISIDLGLLYKTKGFLPEEVFLNEHFGVRIGTTIRL